MNASITLYRVDYLDRARAMHARFFPSPEAAMSHVLALEPRERAGGEDAIVPGSLRGPIKTTLPATAAALCALLNAWT